MKQRSTRPIVLLGVSVLVFLILGVAFVAVSLPCLSAHADGNVFKVPDDYPTIQAAIDAATAGDTILVAQGVYAENLAITKGITLTGGWDPTFSTRHPGDSTIDGQGLGRVISITCAANDTIVAIDGFTIMNGDASGLGALELPDVPPSVGLSAGSEKRPVAQGRDPVNPTGYAADLRAHLAELAARGLYPGGASALQAMLEQLEWRTAQAEQARARANSVPARWQADPEQGPGAGGGVYSWNASLHLLNSTIVDNVASQDGQGAGGGIYVGQAAHSGVRIAGNVVVRNVASGGDDGWGGGLYVYQAPGVIIEDNGFVDNVGSAGGYDTIGLGGGLEVDASPNVVVRRNEIERNTANTTWDAQSGAGGGMHLQGSSGAELRANVLRSNLAALRNHGNGGGLFLFESDDVLLADNTIAGNWAVMFGEEHINGGGALLDRANRAIFTGNMVDGNTAGVYVRGLTGDVCLGGGLLVAFSNNPQVADNTISGNVACHFHYGGGNGGIAHGGGGVLQLTYEAEVSGNTFTDNVGSLSDMTGNGGGLYVDGTRNSHVRGNVFQENRGGTDGDGGGGALVLIGWSGVHLNTTVDSNLFLHNQASASLNLASGSNGGACADTLTTGSTFINNVVAGNVAAQGGGIVLTATRQGQLINNTLVDNADSGVIVNSQSPIELVNNIVVSHTVGISVTEGTTATVSYTLWYGNGTDIAGSGVINQTHPVTGDPAFSDPAAGDYRLTMASAARDAGDTAGVPPAPDHDADGVTRPQGPAVDIGAYEWQGHWQYLPLAFKSFSPRVGWAIGDDAAGTAVIVHTANSGLTWQVQGDSTAWTGLEGNDISAVDNLTAWAALGSGPSETAGAILHTTDGGATWVTQTIPAGLAGGIKGVKGLSRHEAWAASLAGTILHTTDGGSTWNVVPHPTVPITQVNRMDAMGTNVWVADASAAGALVHSSDGGLTWQAIYLPGDSPLTVHAFSPLAVWVSGSDINLNPSFYRTVDGGDQWVRVDELGALDHLDDVCAASPDDAWGVANGDGVSGRIWRAHVAADGTPDAKNITPPELRGYTPGGVTCLDSTVAWVVAQKGVPPDPTKPLGIILHTVDGEHWAQQSAPTHVRYWKVSFVGARKGNDLTVGPGQEYATIQAAVDAAKQGIRIVVYPGTYTEAVSVTTNNLQIIAQGEGVLVVPSHTAGFQVLADHVTVQGFQIAFGADCASGIRFQGSHNTFADNYMYLAATCFGVNALVCRDPDGGSDYNIVERNTIDHADLGIVIVAETADAINTGNIIRDNTLLHVDQDPIAVGNGSGFLVSGNRIDGAPYGICIAVGTLDDNKVPQGHHTIVKNTMGGCADNGISLYAWPGTVLTHNRVADNTIQNCAGDCLALEAGAGSTLTHNEVISNSVSFSFANGIYLASDQDADVSDNLIQGNLAYRNRYDGIYLTAGADHNRVMNNESQTNNQAGIAVAGDDNLIVGNWAHDNDTFDLADWGESNRWPNNTYGTANW